ncbi:MAG: outer membrane protein assembly factor BamC [Candidatus Accumulibacter phosphatis]|jgi:outer membrane protein assembly factor BamC|uniref:Lipoprotein n=2 Tax=Candidatus Accumulibacter TaxID=327159 RepID=A0A080LW87_9PROT|nr:MULTISPECIES: outer membrane protein assembly factor BamC [Candidatus Accumulibacter]KFB73012.1 MAG: lipoprotein [Candidatus Accumulibacter phosphatis]NMQ05322.1 outer membrane protein assembly factor BamC [Candidatus Accumulibacter contiguus]HCZ14504.1 outer membrane protein assembly factor BamC [Accumulibacter sp.]HRF11280.1 outer membrane protein assembly factor BamC [Candidatus Accumulibacter phosphatis]
MSLAVLRCRAALLLLLLAGCGGSLLEPKRIEYKTAAATNVPTLEVPPDLTSPTRDDRYAVPDTIGKGTATYSAYTAERSPQARAQQKSEVLPEVDRAHIERSGNQRWLVAAGAPDKLWGQVKDFWQETGFVIKLELPDAGVMETDWAENRAKIEQDFIRNLLGKLIDSVYSTAERDKFRTRLEPGSTPGTTDIFISHRGMYEIYVTEGRDQTKWQPRPADPELEAEMLRRLMIRLGSDEKRAAEAVRAAQEKPVERARLTRGADGAGTLEVEESFDRAWRRVGLALDRVGFTVEDRDRSRGLYFVRYVDPESDNQKKEDTFLSRLNPFKGSSADKVQIQYRIFVREAGSLSTVQVLSTEGGISQSDTARKILNLLYDQLK